MDTNSGNTSPGPDRPQSRSRTQERSDTRSRTGQNQHPASRMKPLPGMDEASTSKKAAKQETVAINDVSTPGRNGEQNITVEWYWEWVGNSLPAGWKIQTLEGHELEVTVEILNYRKTHTGTTRVDTGLAPCTVEMVGSKGELRITDLATGEKRTIVLGVYLLPGPLGKLWRWIKKLFVR